MVIMGDGAVGGTAVAAFTVAAVGIIDVTSPRLPAP